MLDAEFDQRVADAFVELAAPPFLYEWASGRREITDSAQRLRALLASLNPQHPAVPELMTATRRVEAWLSHWPAAPELPGYHLGPRQWNEEIVPALLETWGKIGGHLAPSFPRQVN